MSRLAVRPALLLLAPLLLFACHGPRESGAQRETDAQARSPSCPERAPAPSPLANTSPEQETLAYWLAQSSAEELDRPLLPQDAVAFQDQALRVASDGTPRVTDLGRTLTRAELLAQIAERLNAYGKKLASGTYRSADPGLPEVLRSDPGRQLEEAPALRVALAPIELSCVPRASAVFSTVDDPRIDRNRCSRARAQEPVEVWGRYGQLLLARTHFAWGFIAQDAPLSPAVPGELTETFRTGPGLVLRRAETLAGSALPAGTLLKSAAREGETARAAWLANAQGFQRVVLAAQAATSARRAITRRALLEEAFSLIGTPYGWGDQHGGRDCSRFVLDVLARFDLHFPRTSGEQSLSGHYSLEVPGEASLEERTALLDEAQRRGVVLLHFPGHIMLYLGRDHAGVPRVVHSLAEFMAPCKEGGETRLEVNAVRVSDLQLGSGTSRRSLLERITRMTVLGTAPGHALLAFSRFRAPQPPRELAPRECKDSLDVALFHSPRTPRAGSPLRVVVAAREETRPAGLWLVSPEGQLSRPPVHELGVGPFGRWVELAAPTPGRWTALVADGERVLACMRMQVAAAPRTRAAPATTPDSGPAPGETAVTSGAPEQPAWRTRAAWQRDTENLFAMFVEQLFTLPEAHAGSFRSLSPLLADPKQNLLFDHLGLGEDARLQLAPDCADLPYFLRAYFAWKLGLPFAFRHCSRGRAGVPPRCGAQVTNQLTMSSGDRVSVFDKFLRAQVSSGVHSASGRTLPDDPASDLYPLPLTREALRPGTVFADPYGHVIVLAKWLPQGLSGTGMLLGADAQPDATVAIKRFWRGNFLFSPDTREVGAGFKAFRPVVRAQASAELAALDEQALQSSPHFSPRSLEQYQGSREDFYARMDELIYPRAIAVEDRMRQLVDALYEQVVRRAEAVDVGEAAMKRIKEPISMPEGHALFETSGPWEDFATPSRDMRLLIALDAARSVVDELQKRPARFGVRPERAQEESARVARELSAQLAARRFRYTRSDGSAQELSLADVVARQQALEVAYNPNDCVEVRWGAPLDSAERASCTRTAPPAQRARMERYREWFRARTRPARP